MVGGAVVVVVVERGAAVVVVVVCFRTGAVVIVVARGAETEVRAGARVVLDTYGDAGMVVGGSAGSVVRVLVVVVVGLGTFGFMRYIDGSSRSKMMPRSTAPRITSTAIVTTTRRKCTAGLG